MTHGSNKNIARQCNQNFLCHYIIGIFYIQIKIKLQIGLLTPKYENSYKILIAVNTKTALVNSKLNTCGFYFVNIPRYVCLIFVLKMDECVLDQVHGYVVLDLLFAYFCMWG